MGILVIGCGVSGLSSAIRLREAGYDARIWARDLPPNTTSNIAAAVWYPYKAYPEELVGRWGTRAFLEFARLAEIPAAGVRVRETLELLAEPAPDPWWRDTVVAFRRAAPVDLPAGYRDGYLFEAPVIETPIYLAYLIECFRDLGGTIEQRTLARIDEAFAAAPIVVNCVGLGARELVGDTSMLPIRGQLVRVAQIGLERSILDDRGPHGPTYIVPRSNDCILGGTAQEGEENLAPDPAAAESILARCIALEPRLRTAQVLEHRVGLRPGRPAVRLEAEQRSDGLLVHNYGHGGAGVTLSWGCAEDVVALVAALG